MTVADDTLLVRAAELYYEDNRTQDEIGSLLKVTRWKVGRLLAQAREDGIVRIEIVHPRARRLPAERALCERFGLRDAVVVPAGEQEAQARVASAAADYLQELRPAPLVLGVSWGRTLEEVARSLPEGWSTAVDVVQVNGGVSLTSRGSNAAATAVTIASKGGGSATLLPTPAILERAETRVAIEADRTVGRVLDLAAGASAYLFSAGVADETSVLVESGYLSAGDIARLAKAGAVGDVVGRYIDARGAIVDHALDERTIGLGHDRIRAAHLSIAVIAGAAKHRVARSVVASGLCTVLITDEATALALLEKEAA
ncbi:MAG: transcriptional regulator [Microbacteriaceae bacterium]|nr:transcriptional regulator [Microbacteriaceae bacterium]